MTNSKLLLVASLTLIGASCVDHDNVSTTSRDVTNHGAATQSACTVRTPTSWGTPHLMCTHPIRSTIPLEIGESVRIESFRGGGGYLDLHCDAQGLHLIDQLCEGVCELCM